ncbi:hypothetical protein Tco_1274217 [Tanacetum coccineum]
MAKLRMKDKDKEIRVKPMRYNPEDQKEFQSQIEELLDSKLIRPSHSPHSSPAFLVRKHAEIVRGKARMNGLALSEKKTNLLQKEIEFLGMKLDGNGIELQSHIL